MKYIIALTLFLAATAVAAPKKIGHPSFLSPHSRPIAVHGNQVFVANTPADTADIIDAGSRRVVHRINVGVDPVCVAVRPDGKEIWVANHVSDSVSVIDNDKSSPTYLHVIATIQDINPATKATRFDEPVGIAFANNDKAYVALSSENRIAVINVATRKITRRLIITAQDPRAIVVRGDRLYVLPFESNNKTQLSGGAKGEIDGNLVTFDAWEHSIRVNNVLSIGHKTDIVKHPEVPDRDLYIYDTKTDKFVTVVNTIGTLLYGMTVDSRGNVFVAQTDARNDVNGRAGTKGHGLKEMENRAFLNQITRINFDGDKSSTPEFIELEPLPPNHPTPGQALATPFAIQISKDDSTLFATAAGSDKLFTVDAKSGKILDRVAVDSVPRGITLKHDQQGKATQAWVLNAVANTVSLVDVSNPEDLKVEAKVTLQDPTDHAFKRGRIAFNKAGRIDDRHLFLCQLSSGRPYRSTALGPQDPDRHRRQSDHAPFHHARAWTARHGTLPLGRNSRRPVWWHQQRQHPQARRSELRHRCSGERDQTPHRWRTRRNDGDGRQGRQKRRRQTRQAHQKGTRRHGQVSAQRHLSTVPTSRLRQ